MHDNIRVIGISGPSGSGKSTLAAYLCEHLPDAVIIHADTYYKKELPQMESPYDHKIYSDWNHPDSIDHDAMCRDIDDLCQKGGIRYLLVDGAFIFCIEEIRKRLDYKIFVMAQIETRLYRRICRNITLKKQTPEFIGGYYLACVRYREAEFSVPSQKYADLVVQNEYDFQPCRDEILEKCK